MNLSLAWLSLIHSQNHPHTQMVQHSIILVLTAIDGAIVYTTYYVRLRYITRNITIEDSVSLWTNVSIVDIIRAICGGQLIYANVFIHSLTHFVQVFLHEYFFGLVFGSMSLFAKKVRTDTVNSRKGSIRFGERHGTEERIEKQPYRSRVASTLLFLLSKENMEVLFYVAACHYTTYDRNGKQCVCVGRWQQIHTVYGRCIEIVKRLENTSQATSFTRMVQIIMFQCICL